jgi:hypothetical protein
VPDPIELRRIVLAIAADEYVDPRSVRAELSGRRVRGMVGQRIRRALLRYDLLPPQQEMGDAMARPNAEVPT